MEAASVLPPWNQAHPYTSDSDIGLLTQCHDVLDLLMAEGQASVGKG